MKKRPLNQELMKFWLWWNVLDVLIRSISSGTFESCLECKKYSGAYHISFPSIDTQCHRQEVFDRIFLLAHKHNSQICVKPIGDFVGIEISQIEDDVVYEILDDEETEASPEETWTSYFTSLYSRVFGDKSNTCVECEKKEQFFIPNPKNPSKLEQFHSLIYGSSIARNFKEGVCQSSRNTGVYQLGKSPENILNKKSLAFLGDDLIIDGIHVHNISVKNDSAVESLLSASNRDTNISIDIDNVILAEHNLSKNIDFFEIQSQKTISDLPAYPESNDSKTAIANVSVIKSNVSIVPESIKLELTKDGNTSQAQVKSISDTQSWYYNFMNYLKLSCTFSSREVPTEDSVQKKVLPYENWFYWFLKTFRLRTPKIIHDDTDSNIEMWWKKFTRLLDNASVISTKESTVPVSNDIGNWWKTFSQLLKNASAIPLKESTICESVILSPSKEDNVSVNVVKSPRVLPEDWYIRFTNYLRLTCPYFFKKLPCTNCFEKQEIPHESWYYWFQNTFKLRTPNKLLIKSGSEDNVETTRTGKTNERDWYDRFKNYLRLSCPYSFEKLPSSSFQKEEIPYGSWYYRFQNTLKLQTPNKLLTKCRDEDDIETTRTATTNDWYDRFVLSLKLHCKTIGIPVEEIAHQSLNTTLVVDDVERMNETQGTVDDGKFTEVCVPSNVSTISKAETVTQEDEVALKDNITVLLQMDGADGKVVFPEAIVGVLMHKNKSMLQERWKHLRNRVYRGDVSDSAFTTIFAILAVMFLWNFALKPGFLINTPAVEQAVVEQISPPKRKPRVSKTPAAVIAARKKLQAELELVVAIVEISPD